MLRGISDLKRFTIAATDGNLGSVRDLYFDDRSWAVRYLVVDVGPWLPGRRVFVSPTSVRRSDPTTLRLGLSMRQVEISSVSSAQPWGVLPATPARAGDGGDSHLQTATAVMGYAIRAEDGKIGHVKDVLVDDKAWAIRYLVVDTEHWWAGKTVLVSPGWLTRVAWDESKTLFCLVTAVGDAGAAGRPVLAERAHHKAGFTQASDWDVDPVPVQLSGFVRPQTDIDTAVQVAHSVARGEVREERHAGQVTTGRAVANGSPEISNEGN